MVVLVCTIYQGLLCISYIVADPFGDDLLDFPVVAYTEYLSWSFAAVERAATTCPALTGDKLGPILAHLLPHVSNASVENGDASIDDLLHKSSRESEKSPREAEKKSMTSPKS